MRHKSDSTATATGHTASYPRASSRILKVKRTLFPKRLHVPVKRKRRAQHSMPAHTHCKYQTSSLAPQRSLAFGLRRAGSSPGASFLALEGTSGCAVSLGNPSVLFLPCLSPLERPSLTSNRAASSHDHMRENFPNFELGAPGTLSAYSLSCFGLCCGTAGCFTAFFVSAYRPCKSACNHAYKFKLTQRASRKSWYSGRCFMPRSTLAYHKATLLRSTAHCAKQSKPCPSARKAPSPF